MYPCGSRLTVVTEARDPDMCDRTVQALTCVAESCRFSLSEHLVVVLKECTSLLKRVAPAVNERVFKRASPRSGAVPSKQRRKANLQDPERSARGRLPDLYARREGHGTNTPYEMPLVPGRINIWRRRRGNCVEDVLLAFAGRALTRNMRLRQLGLCLHSTASCRSVYTIRES